MNRSRLLALAAIAVLCAAVSSAQDTTGVVSGAVLSPDGAVLPGAIVTVENTGTGLARTAVTNKTGAYRFAALPTGPYQLTASADGFSTHQADLTVTLGAMVHHPVTLEVGAFTDVIEIGGDIPVVDVGSSQTGQNLDVGRLDMLLPLNHDTTQIATLVPGTVPGDPIFNPVDQACATGCGDFNVGWGTPGQDLLSFNGGSIADNLYVVDGLNITNFSQGMGSSFVPMAFVDEVQVKQGGLEAEFGRTTGGVVNMVTRSGTNTLRGDAAVWWSPENLQEQSPSTYTRDFENETWQSTELTASLGGPLSRDRLFFFLFLRYLDSEKIVLPSLARYEFSESSPYWGGKLDWSLNPGNRLTASYISDSVAVDKTRELTDPEPGADGGNQGQMNRGGGNVILRYTGVLTDSLLFSAQIGRNTFDRYDGADTDECPVAFDYRYFGNRRQLGCWVVDRVGTWEDKRTAGRAEIDWFLGDHSLRGGIDYELATTDVDYGSSGGIEYAYFFGYVPQLEELVQVYAFNSRGELDIESTAVYAQDSWALTRNLTLNLGLRWESYEHRNANGEAFFAIEDQLSPRLGVVWDPSGSGLSKLYASLGTYSLPYPSSASEYYGAAWTEGVEVYLMGDGILPDGSPDGLGDLISSEVWRDGEVLTPREISADSISPIEQRELVLGFDQMVGANWTLSIRGMARQVESVIEDFFLNQALWDVYGVPCLDPEIVGESGACWGAKRVGNPGEDFDGWYDLDGDGELDRISLTAEQIGLPEPQRDYYAVDLVASRRFADNWMLQASYTWSQSYGNHEGLVRSDFGDVRAGRTVDFDWLGLMEHSYGDLPNDRRHFGRVYGAYSLPWGLGLGGAFYVQSGRPINSFGFNPDDPWALEDEFYYGGPRSFYTDGEPAPRASMGRTETLWWLDLTARFDWQWGNTSMYVRADAFNVLDNQGVARVEERGEYLPHIPYDYWGEPLYYQSPRSVRLGLGVSF